MTSTPPPNPTLIRVPKGAWWISEPAVLYLDDVDAIHRAFQDASSGVTLQLGGYELASIEQASHLNATETADLRIESHRPYATFEAAVWDFRLYISDANDLVQVGLRDRVREIVKKRRIWSPKLIGRFHLFLVPPLLLWFIPRNTPLALFRAALVLALACLIAFVLSAIVGFRNGFRRSGKVMLRDSRSKRSFRKENRDLMLVLWGIVGTLVTTILAGVILYALGFGH